MSEIKVAFWNLQNLFDTVSSEIALDFDFIPSEGWTESAYEKKIENLAQVINKLHEKENNDDNNEDFSPDLLGICEVENKKVVEDLITKIGRSDYKIAHKESPDFRGIDVSLIYSGDLLELKNFEGHLIHKRYPTRDICVATFRVKQNDAELVVFVNHWSSRSSGILATEPMRITVAEHCGMLVDEVLKFNREEYAIMPDNESTRDKLLERWDRNILLMGDFNDEPFDKSILDYLRAGRDLDRIEEELLPKTKNKHDLKDYLKSKRPYLVNCMWPLLGNADKGSYFYSGTTNVNTMHMLDQFIVSRGLYYGNQKIKMLTDTVKVYSPQFLWTSQDSANRKGKERPKRFNKDTLDGYSDHFPVICSLEIL